MLKFKVNFTESRVSFLHSIKEPVLFSATVCMDPDAEVGKDSQI